LQGRHQSGLRWCRTADQHDGQPRRFPGRHLRSPTAGICQISRITRPDGRRLIFSTMRGTRAAQLVSQVSPTMRSQLKRLSRCACYCRCCRRHIDPFQRRKWRQCDNRCMAAAKAAIQIGQILRHHPEFVVNEKTNPSAILYEAVSETQIGTSHPCRTNNNSYPRGREEMVCQFQLQNTGDDRWKRAWDRTACSALQWPCKSSVRYLCL